MDIKQSEIKVEGWSFLFYVYFCSFPLLKANCLSNPDEWVSQANQVLCFVSLRLDAQSTLAPLWYLYTSWDTQDFPGLHSVKVDTFLGKGYG